MIPTSNPYMETHFKYKDTNRVEEKGQITYHAKNGHCQV